MITRFKCFFKKNSEVSDAFFAEGKQRMPQIGDKLPFGLQGIFQNRIAEACKK